MERNFIWIPLAILYLLFFIPTSAFSQQLGLYLAGDPSNSGIVPNDPTTWLPAPIDPAANLPYFEWGQHIGLQVTGLDPAGGTVNFLFTSPNAWTLAVNNIAVDPTRGIYWVWWHLTASGGDARNNTSLGTSPPAGSVVVNPPGTNPQTPGTWTVSATQPGTGWSSSQSFIIHNPIELILVDETNPANTIANPMPWHTAEPNINGYTPTNIPVFYIGRVSHGTTGTNGLFLTGTSWIGVRLAVRNDSCTELTRTIRVDTQNIHLRKQNPPYSLGITTNYNWWDNRDYPDIPGYNMVFTPSSFTIGTQDLPAPTTSPTGHWEALTIHVEVPEYQPDDMADNPGTGDPMAGAFLNWKDDDNEGYMTRHPTNPTDLAFMLKIFVDSNGNGTPNIGENIEEAYRPFILRLWVPPDPRFRIVERVLDLGKVWHGNYLSYDANSTEPYKEIGWSGYFDPISNQFKGYKTFTLENIGNRNLWAGNPFFYGTRQDAISMISGDPSRWNLKLLLAVPDPANPSATLYIARLASQDTDSAINIPSAPWSTNSSPSIRAIKRDETTGTPAYSWWMLKPSPIAPDVVSPVPTSLVIDPGISVRIPMFQPVGTYFSQTAFSSGIWEPGIFVYKDDDLDDRFTPGEVYSDTSMVLKVSVIESPTPPKFIIPQNTNEANQNVNTIAGDSLPTAFGQDTNADNRIDTVWAFWSSNRLSAAGGLPNPNASWDLYSANFTDDGDGTNDWQAVKLAPTSTTSTSISIGTTTIDSQNPNNPYYWLLRDYPYLASYENKYPCSLDLLAYTGNDIKYIFWHLETLWRASDDPNSPDYKRLKRLHFFCLGFQSAGTWNLRVFPDTPSIKYNPKAFYDVRGTPADTADDLIWVFWHGNFGGQPQIYYNVIYDLFTGNPRITPDRKLPLSSGLMHSKEPSAFLDIWDTLGQATGGLVNVFYAGTSKMSGNDDILWSRYYLSTNDLTNPGLLEYAKNPALPKKPERLWFAPVTGEILRPNATRTVFYAQNIDWVDTRRLSDPRGNIPRIYLNGTLITTDPATGDEVYEIEKTTGFLVYLDPLSGVPILKIDTATGTVRFITPLAPTDIVTADYTPRTRRLTTDPASEGLPSVFIEPLSSFSDGSFNPHLYNISPGSSLYNPRKLWILYRRTVTPQKAAAFYYQTLIYDFRIKDWVNYLIPLVDSGIEDTPCHSGRNILVPALSDRTIREFLVPIDTKVNEGQLAAFPDWLTRVAAEPDSSNPSVTNLRDIYRICLFWMSTRQPLIPTGGIAEFDSTGNLARGNWDIYYETISPRFVP